MPILRFKEYNAIAEAPYDPLPAGSKRNGKLDKSGTVCNIKEDADRKLLGRRRRAANRAKSMMYKTIKDSASDLIFNEIDSDGNGLISKRELKHYSSQKRQPDTESEKSPSFSSFFTSDAIFDKLDLDGNGGLTQAEVSGSLGLSLADHEFSVLDIDGDGVIDRQEFGRAGALGEFEETLEGTLGDLEPLERQQFRLDGFDPYILVSVLTAQASFDAINEYQVVWGQLATKTSLESLTVEDWVAAALLVTAASSTLVGVYAAVVFSLSVRVALLALFAVL